MVSHSCAPYRGYGIYLKVMEFQTTSFDGQDRRYTVTWSIHRDGPFLSAALASFLEPVEFMSVGEALDHGEGRAHTFIDSMLASGTET